MTSIDSITSHPAGFKVAIFALLTLNTAVFLASGTPSEALDSIAWLALLVLFELETGAIGRLRWRHAIPAIRAVRLAAVAALVAAMIGYLHEKAWLDTLNAGLWCAVVALLEFEVRRPAAWVRHRSFFAATAIALYSGLAAVVAAWLWQGEWFDAYDAALWLVAFATLEVDVLGFIGKRRPAA